MDDLGGTLILRNSRQSLRVTGLGDEGDNFCIKMWQLHFEYKKLHFRLTVAGFDHVTELTATQLPQRSGPFKRTYRGIWYIVYTHDSHFVPLWVCQSGWIANELLEESLNKIVQCCDDNDDASLLLHWGLTWSSFVMAHQSCFSIHFWRQGSPGRPTPSLLRGMSMAKGASHPTV